MAWYKCSGGGEGIPLITKSGSIVEYEDSVGGVPINDLVAEITPIQASGTPSPTNPLPISGYTEGVITRCGKNLANLSTVDAVNFSLSDGVISNTQTDSRSYFAFQLQTFNGNSLLATVASSSISSTGIFSAQFTIPSGTVFDSLRIKHSGSQRDFRLNFPFRKTGTFTISFNVTSVDPTTVGGLSFKDVQVEIGTATTYEPYQATTQTVQFNQTVYGGTWKASQGKVVDKYAEFTIPTITSFSISSGHKYKSNTISDMESAPQRAGDLYSAILTYNGALGDYFNIYHTGIYAVIGVPDNYTVEEYNQEIAGTKIYYPLATPTEINVEAVNFTAREGTNNIFANTGNLTAKFYKSTVDNLETLVEQTKDLAPDVIALASSGNKFDLTDDTTGTKATKIANYMFYKNANVENISLSTIEEVGEYSFEDCKYIKGINLPNCTTLKKEAFYNACQSHTSTTLPSVAINLPKVTVVNDRSLSQIGYANGLTATLVLTACTEIKANGIRGMGSAYMRIAELLLPNLVTLGQESFNYNVIETIDIGENCTTINSKPFNYCTITNLIVRATTPPTLHNNGLGVTPTHIYVPSASVETYKTTSNWSTYASVIEAIPS